VLDFVYWTCGDVGIGLVEAAAHGGDTEHIAEEAGAAEMHVSLGSGVEEHGGGEQEGFGVLERREVELILVWVSAGDLHGVFAGTDEGLLVAVIRTVASIYDLARGERRWVVFVEADVEVAEGFAVECGRLAAVAVGFEVAADRDSEFLRGHCGSFARLNGKGRTEVRPFFHP